MFIYTARLRPRRLFFCAAALMLLLGTVMGFQQYAGQNLSVGLFSESTKLKDEESQRMFLEGLGYTITDDKPLIEELKIPKSFDNSYNTYLALQESQGFSLTDYTGKSISRCTYLLTEFEGGDEALASLLLYKNKLIAGEIYLEDGTMLPLIPPVAEEETHAEKQA